MDREISRDPELSVTDRKYEKAVQRVGEGTLLQRDRPKKATIRKDLLVEDGHFLVTTEIIGIEDDVVPSPS